MWIHVETARRLRSARGTRRTQFVALAILGAGGLLVTAAWGAGPTSPTTLVARPATKHSSLNASDGKDILDDDFAALMGGLLGTDGNPGDPAKVKDAKFMFEECFGGGMLDALKTTLGAKDSATSIPWVGGSASQWNEPSYGPGNPTTLGDRWVNALNPQLAIDQTLLTGLTNAQANDTAAISGKEHPQTYYGDSGNTIKLQDGATSHHAIIWAGIPDGDRHINDINMIKNSLIAAWGPLSATNTITVLQGDGTAAGTLPATRDQLVATINDLKTKLGPNEQFLFFATDHGDETTVIKAPDTAPTPVAPRTTDHETFLIDSSELLAYQLGGTGFLNLTITWDGIVSASDGDFVSVNGNSLGILDPSLASPGALSGELTQIFQVPVGDLFAGSTDAVDIFDGSFTSPFNIDSKYLEGVVDTLDDTTVPEPASLGLLGFGMAGLLKRRRQG